MSRVAVAIASLSGISFPTLSISPSSLTTAPEGTQTFAGVGGSGHYSYSLATNNSGGAINSSSGAYNAGHVGDVSDVVRVTDTVTLQHADATVTVTTVLSISPSSATKAPLGTQTFTGVAGGGTYAYTMQSAPSGGSVGVSSGIYTAGSTGSVTDVVRVTDIDLEHADANVTVTAALAISPSSLSTTPAGSQSFTATGGAGSNVFSLLTNNSGGSCSSGGAYVAGHTGSVSDVVRVTDANGAHSDCTVTVSASLAVTGGNISVAGNGGTHNFAATGGSGSGYTWALTTDQSTASCNSSGNYATGVAWTHSGSASVDVVTVTDSLGNTATASITNTVPTVPSISTTLTGQYDAEQGITSSGGLISNWADATATLAAFTAVTTARPTYTAAAANTLHGVTFNGSANTFTSAITLANIIGTTGHKLYTFIAAVKYTGSTAENAADYKNPCILSDTSGYQTFWADVTNFGNGRYNQKRVVTAVSASLTIISGWADASNFWIQKDQGAAVSGDATIDPGGTAGTIYMGRNTTQSGNYWTGDIYEVLIFKADIGNTDRLTIQKYLASKWKNASS